MIDFSKDRDLVVMAKAESGWACAKMLQEGGVMLLVLAASHDNQIARATYLLLCTKYESVPTAQELQSFFKFWESIPIVGVPDLKAEKP